MPHILCFFLLLSAFSLSAQAKPCACCTEAHDAFNFWLGEWQVFDAEGKWLGDNSIQKLEDNCILNERWTGTSGTKGRSYNYYDPVDTSWNQLWLDNQGTILKLKGHSWETGRMTMYSAYFDHKEGRVRHRIEWKLTKRDEVTQRWEIIDEKDEVQQLLFLGKYERKSEEPRRIKE